MKIKLDYGDHGMSVDLPDDVTTVIQPRPRPALPDPHAALLHALRNPIGLPRLRDTAPRGATVGISVCDITRAQPRPQMLRAILEEMPQVRTEDVTVFVATGTHRGNTAAEVEAMLGPDLAGELRVVMHDSRDPASLTYLGETSNGVPVWLNHEWVESDIKITTGFVEPHFFAGFSGGPKMVAPGLAGLDTVMVLHDAKRIGHPRAVWGVTEGNPVHDDVREIARLTGVDFALDVTLNRDQQITAVFAGDLSVEHAAACEAARRDAMQPVEAPFDVVLTTNSGYPLDQNLYQSVKGISAAAEVVKPGGQIICVAECRDGLPDHGAYAAILAEKGSPAELLEMINSPGYSTPDQWQVQIQAQIQMKASVSVVAGCLDPEQIRAAHFEPAEDATKAALQALATSGPGATLCVLPQGPQTIPYIARST